MFETFDFGEHVISKYIDFEVDPHKTFEEQMFSFKLDMIQISYSNNYVLDVGWYPELVESGHFVVVVIFDHDWSNPCLRFECQRLEQLEAYLHMCVDYISQLS